MALLRPLAIILIVAVLAAMPAAGFSLDVHEAILKDALGDGNTLSAEALTWVTGSFFGGGNRGSDRHQMSPERHFDGARNPADICNRWEKGLNTFLKRAVELAVRGMLPHNRLGRALIKKLKVYAGPDHPHAAQQPKPFEIKQLAQ